MEQLIYTGNPIAYKIPILLFIGLYFHTMLIKPYLDQLLFVEIILLIIYNTYNIITFQLHGQISWL